MAGATPPPSTGHAKRWLGAAAVLLTVLVLLVAGSVAWLWQGLHTETGTRWWLQQAAARVPGLQVEAPTGALLGERAEFSLARLVVQAGRLTVRIDGLRIVGLRLTDGLLQAPHAHVQARLLAAQRVTVETSPETEPSPPAAAPADLRLPVTARIDSLRIDELRLPGLTPPLMSLTARLEAGDTHRIDALSLRWNGLLADGQVQIDAASPMALRAQVDVRGDAQATDVTLPAWARELTLAVQASGPLSRFDTQAVLTMQAQRLEAKAQVTPFATASPGLPLRQFDASFAQLDLSRLLAPFEVSSAPTTALSGTLKIQLDPGGPMAIDARVSNALPGRWDQGRAPLRELDVQARGQGAQWEIEKARSTLASDERTPAGTLEVTGRYDAGQVEASLQLGNVRLQGLDERAPPLRLAGPIALKHSPPDAGAAGPLGKLAVDARLTGTFAAPPAARTTRVPTPVRDAVQFAVKGSLTPEQLVVDMLSARAGPARLDGKGRARRDAAAWNVDADLKLAAFDPTLWWPGEPNAAWRRARNVLNGQATLKAQVPIVAARPATTAAPDRPRTPAPPSSPDSTQAPPAWLAGLRGALSAELQDSALAGQALVLSLQADADGRGNLTAQADAAAAGNSARVDLKLRSASGSTPPSTGATDERLVLDIDAPALAGLSPVTQLLGLGPLAGKAKADARIEGPIGAWLFGGTAGAALVTRGNVALDGLQAGPLLLARAGGQWDLTLPGGGTAGTPALSSAALQAKLEAVRLQMPGLLVPQAALVLDGTLAQHRAQLSATLRALSATGASTATAATVAQAPRDETPVTAGGGAQAAAPEPAPLTLDLQATGAWQAGAGTANSLWRGRIRQLALQPTQTGKAPAALALVNARDIDLEIEQGPQTLRASAAPGRAEVLGAVLRWSRAQWVRQGETPARTDLQAEVEPFLVAQLLQRLQPDFGWEGDLRVGAQIDVRSEPAVTAKVEITRRSGDLQVNELGTVQKLGLRELRMDLNAQDGLWRMTQVVDGETLGRLAGAQTVQTDARQMWPPAEAPVTGALRLQVEQLSTWGAWVPAGWRLGGNLDGVLRIAGRFGAPELIGELTGRQLALRNALEGVALSEGELDARFEGGTAELKTLRFKAGDGVLRASGTARLGEEPEAHLEAVAERATVLGRVDRKVVLSGQAALMLDAKTVKIDGDVRADEGLIDISRGDAPSLGDDVTVRRPNDVPRPVDAAPPRPPRAVDLRLSVNLGDRFRLRGRGIDTRLAGDLKLTTPDGRLVAYGEIRTERGTYEAYGQKLDIERGVITFVGDIANPRLDISAVRANTDTRVGVNVGGNAQAPRIRLFSDPEMPATDKLALLVTGRSYDSLGGTETVMLQRAALALLAGEGGGNDSFDVARMLKLDELSVRQSDGAVRETVVTLGKQLSDRVYVGYERGLNAAAGNWQLIYRIAQRFTLRAQSGEDPAVDLIWVFRWN